MQDFGKWKVLALYSLLQWENNENIQTKHEKKGETWFQSWVFRSLSWMIKKFFSISNWMLGSYWSWTILNFQTVLKMHLRPTLPLKSLSFLWLLEETKYLVSVGLVHVLLCGPGKVPVPWVVICWQQHFDVSSEEVRKSLPKTHFCSWQTSMQISECFTFCQKMWVELSSPWNKSSLYMLS